MNRTAAALALLLGLTVTGCASSDPAGAPAAVSASALSSEPTASAGTSSAEQPATSQAGAWVDRAGYAAEPSTFHRSGDVVLFFTASWCPTCTETVRSLDASGVPAGLTVVSVDFDAATDLRRQYGVTVQHTFVQIDEAGDVLAKFTGALSGEAIAAQTV